MEIRQSLRETAVPKGLVAMLAISVGIALVAMGAAVAKDTSTSSAPATTTYHAAPGTVLRQDNPARQSSLLDRGAERGASQISAAAGTHFGRSSGNQVVGDVPGLDAGAYGPQSDLTRALPVQRAANNAGLDAHQDRAGHGV